MYRLAILNNVSELAGSLPSLTGGNMVVGLLPACSFVYLISKAFHVSDAYRAIRARRQASPDRLNSGPGHNLPAISLRSLWSGVFIPAIIIFTT